MGIYLSEKFQLDACKNNIKDKTNELFVGVRNKLWLLRKSKLFVKIGLAFFLNFKKVWEGNLNVFSSDFFKEKASSVEDKIFNEHSQHLQIFLPTGTFPHN